MTEKTSDLIQRLGRTSERVKPLPRPLLRTATWIVLSAASIAVIGTLAPIEGLPSKTADPVFLLEQATGLLVGIAAARAAFVSVVPGYDRKHVGLGLLPLAAWLGTMGPGCISEITRLGFGGLSLEHSLSCFPYIVLMGFIPALAMAMMLRRGAPITPHISVGLGALASATLANFSLRLLYPEEVTVMLVVWHVGGVFVLTAIATLAAGSVLNWRSRTAGIRSSTG